MKFKRLATFVTVLLLAAMPVIPFVSPGKVAAAGASAHNWTGAAGDHKMSTAGNWSTNEVPDANDSVYFPAGVGTQQVTDDLASVMTWFVVGVDSSYTQAGWYNYTFTGYVKAKNITTYSPLNNATGVATFSGTLSLYGNNSDFSALVNAAENTTIFLNTSSMVLETLDGLSLKGNGSISINSASVIGSTDRIAASDDVSLAVTGSWGASPSGGFRTNDTAKVNISGAGTGILGTTLSYFASGTQLLFPSGTTIDTPLTFEDGATIRILGVGQGEKVATFSGNVVLDGAVQYDDGHNGVDLKLTGNISGTGTINPIAGTEGDVVVVPGAGKTNTSGTPNGTIAPAVKTTTVTDSNSDTTTVYANNILIVNGQRGDTTVNAGGVLKGIGTVGTLSVLGGGTVAPGQSPGCLSSGNTTFATDSIFEVEIAGNTVCADYDQLHVAGTITLDNAILKPIFLNNFKPKAGDVFTIIDTNGSDPNPPGTFKDLPEGATTTIDGVVFKISYIGGDGNDVTLTVQSVVHPPSAPNTGIQFLASNPLLTLVLTALATGVLFVLSRKYGITSKR